MSLAVACFKIFVLKHAYPRLDINVSKDMRHLLKSPFCIHPKTGIMSVPISPQQVSNLNIDDLPRIEYVLQLLLPKITFQNAFSLYMNNIKGSSIDFIGH